MKNKTCCFTGHRIISSNEYESLKIQVYEAVEKLINNGYERFISGGAMGFDMLSAVVVMALKKKYPNIKLYLCLPCKNQDEKWNLQNKITYKYLIENADEIEILHERYITGCMQERNKKMVDNSSVCIAYLTKSFGGTKTTVDYALDCDLEVIYI